MCCRTRLHAWEAPTSLGPNVAVDAELQATDPTDMHSGHQTQEGGHTLPFNRRASGQGV